MLDDPVYPKVVPPALLVWYRTEPAQWLRNIVYGPEVECGRRTLPANMPANERSEYPERG